MHYILLNMMSIHLLLLLYLASAKAVDLSENFPYGDDSMTDLYLVVHPHDPVGPLNKPVQCIHLNIQNENSMKAVWMSPSSFSEGKFSPTCQYGNGPGSLIQEAKGRAWTYTEGMFMWTLNSAVMDLSRLDDTSATVYYRCGDPKYGWGPTNSFLPHKGSIEDPSGRVPPSIALVGDLGVSNGERTTKSIQNKISSHNIGLLFHAGDIGYANVFGKENGNNSMIWIDLLNQLEGIAKQIPYMTTPGNHERQWQFAGYRNWFRMPKLKSGSEFWFSFDYLGVHVVSFSTEHDFSPNSTQGRWLREDLTKANSNRQQVPWVVVVGHRPLYCSSLAMWFRRCDEYSEAVKYRANLEDLAYQQKVDLVLAGHNHHYERSWPTYDQMPIQENYVNPGGPVYVVNGGAGNPEMNDPTFLPADVPWRAFYYPTLNTGWLRMTPSKQELKFEYFDSEDDKVIDTFTIRRQINTGDFSERKVPIPLNRIRLMNSLGGRTDEVRVVGPKPRSGGVQLIYSLALLLIVAVLHCRM